MNWMGGCFAGPDNHKQGKMDSNDQDKRASLGMPTMKPWNLVSWEEWARQNSRITNLDMKREAF